MAPFGPPFGPILRLVGYGRWEHNHYMCRICIRGFAARPGGAEVEISVLFADIRDSTTIAEGVAPAELTRSLNRFYHAASEAIDEAGGIVDKVMGDGVMALFVPGLVGEDHAAKAIDAGERLLSRADAHGLPVGAGVHTGVAYVGMVGSRDQMLDFTALGDTVNTAARLGSIAAADELLVSAVAARHAGHDVTNLERRMIDAKGKSQPVEVWVVGRS
jgi:adenylate cyclase